MEISPSSNQALVKLAMHIVLQNHQVSFELDLQWKSCVIIVAANSICIPYMVMHLLLQTHLISLAWNLLCKFYATSHVCLLRESTSVFWEKLFRHLLHQTGIAFYEPDLLCISRIRFIIHHLYQFGHASVASGLTHFLCQTRHAYLVTNVSSIFCVRLVIHISLNDSHQKLLNLYSYSCN